MRAFTLHIKSTEPGLIYTLFYKQHLVETGEKASTTLSNPLSPKIRYLKIMRLLHVRHHPKKNRVSPKKYVKN